jgi:hypothetical protein
MHALRFLYVHYLNAFFLTRSRLAGKIYPC